MLKQTARLWPVALCATDLSSKIRVQPASRNCIYEKQPIPVLPYMSRIVASDRLLIPTGIETDGATGQRRSSRTSMSSGEIRDDSAAHEQPPSKDDGRPVTAGSSRHRRICHSCCPGLNVSGELPQKMRVSARRNADVVPALAGSETPSRLYRLPRCYSDGLRRHTVAIVRDGERRRCGPRIRQV